MNALQEYLEENRVWELTNDEIISLMAKKHIDVSIGYISIMPYMLFKYSIEADFNDPVVKCSRGIILDGCNFNIVCAPFDKFGNYNESYADSIDWASAKVQEKFDGSIIKLWFNDYIKEWIWSTNGTILAENAPHPYYGSFLNGILSCKNYKDIPFKELDKTHTYIFEFISPNNQIVIKYPESKLIHIGTRSNLTLKEKNVDIGIEKPQEFPCRNLEETIQFANHAWREGFVVVDKDYHRVKVKNAAYLKAHYLIGKINNPIKVCEIIDNGDAGEITAYVPQLTIFDDFKKVYDTFTDALRANLFAVWEFISHCQLPLSREDRKAIAVVYKRNTLAPLIFKYIDQINKTMGNITIDEFISAVSYKDAYKVWTKPFDEIIKTPITPVMDAEEIEIDKS